MVKRILRRVEKLVAERLPLEDWKQKAATVAGQGIQAALEIAERVQSRMKTPPEPVRAASEPVMERPIAAQPLPPQPEALRQQVQATATRVLDEARAVEERLKKAQPARRPLQVTVEVDGSGARTKGRKTAPSSAAARRVTAPKGGFKAKRGQKHSH